MTMSSVNFTGLPTQSPDLSPEEHIWDVVKPEIGSVNVQLTGLQKSCDAIMSNGAESQREASNIWWNQ